MLATYRDQFAALKTNRNYTYWDEHTRHAAPHKPFLLLAVIDLFAQGQITSNLIELTPDLMDLFNTYWSSVMPADKRGDISTPFYHMRSEPFWHLLTRPEGKDTLGSTSVIRLQNNYFGAELDATLYNLLHDEDSRQTLRATLIQTYFEGVLHTHLMAQSMVNRQAYLYSEELLAQARQHGTAPPSEEVEQPVRDQGFRRALVTAYDHRCGMCGVRILTPDAHTAVVGAHIIPWHISHNDDPRNGMALCRLCHWVFDEGLMTVTPDYEVRVSSQLSRQGNIPAHLGTLDRRGLVGPEEDILWPDRESLRWHMAEVFVR